ncbi:phage holin family protein [Palleronia caenipelagi]|nr:phage holin family protein [Palleronia caenipelagi]
MIPQIAELQYKARLAKRKALWGGVAGALGALAVIFFAIAAWVLLTDLFGTVPTALGFGAFFLILALGAKAFASRPPRVVPKQTAQQLGTTGTPTPVGTTASMINALMLGVTLGRALRK